MSDIVITLIGIITLSCGEPASPGADPCQGTIPAVHVLIPDGRTPSKVCKGGSDPDTDPTVESHEAFIRVRGPRATSTPGPWPGAIECSDHDGGQLQPCILYPLTAHDLTIDGVSTGQGVAFVNVDDYKELRWRNLFPQGQLPKLSGKGQLVAFDVAEGEIKYDTAENMGDAIAATITVKNAPGNATIIRSGKGNNARTLSIPRTSRVDILNVPRFLAISDFAKTHVHDDCDHFLLHYALAENPPASNCPNPAVNNGTCPVDRDSAAATIACSNSTYP